MYQFSKDYHLLYKLICEGHIAVGFVDYRFDCNDPDSHLFRDVVQIRRYKKFDISLFVRGMTYSCLYPFMEKDGYEEEDYFVRVCEGCNLEWIAPHDIVTGD